MQTSLFGFTGKSRMGTEIRRVIAQKAAGCQDKSFWATGALPCSVYAREQPITSICGIC